MYCFEKLQLTPKVLITRILFETQTIKRKLKLKSNNIGFKKNNYFLITIISDGYAKVLIQIYRTTKCRQNNIHYIFLATQCKVIIFY